MKLTLSKIFSKLENMFTVDSNVPLASAKIHVSGVLCLFRLVSTQYKNADSEAEFYEAVRKVIAGRNEKDKNALLHYYLFTTKNKKSLFPLFISFKEGEFSNEAVAQLIDQQIFLKNGSIASDFGEHTDTKILVTVAKDFYNIDNKDVILDPCIGFGYLAANLARPKQIIEGIDINSFAIDVCRIRFMLRDLDTAFLKKDDAFSYDFEKKYKNIVCIPPISLKLHSDNKHAKDRRSHLAFLSLILDLLDEKGRAIIGLPNSSLNLKKNEIVKKLVKDNYLEAVIALPRNALFHTSIPFNLLIIDKNRLKKDNIYFATLSKSDFSRTGKFETITDYVNTLQNYQNREGTTEYSAWVNRDIVANTNTILPLFFTSGLHKKLDSLFAEAPEKYIKLDKLIINAKRGKSSQRIPKQKTDTEYLRNKISVNTLAKQKDALYLDVNSSTLEYNAQPERPADFTAAPDIVLFNMVGDNNYAITFTSDYSKKEFVVPNHIVILKINTQSILSAYLCIQLKSEYVKNQFFALGSGVVQRFISISDLKAIKIYCPPLAEQKKTITEYEELTSGYSSDLQESKESEADSLKTLKHSVKQRIGSADNILTVLKRFLDRKLKEETPLNNTESISKSSKFADLTPWVAVEMLKDELSGIAEIFEGVKSLLNLETKTPTFLKEKVKKFTDERMKPFRHEFSNLDITVSGREVEAYIDKTLLAEVFSNLVRNAAKHSFPDKSEGTLDFEFKKTENNIEIIFRNDGLPFPLGFSFLDYLKKDETAGVYGNTGLGGFIIGKVVKEIHKGDIYPITSIHESPMAFQIILPLNQ